MIISLFSVSVIFPEAVSQSGVGWQLRGWSLIGGDTCQSSEEGPPTLVRLCRGAVRRSSPSPFHVCLFSVFVCVNKKRAYSSMVHLTHTYTHKLTHQWGSFFSDFFSFLCVNLCTSVYALHKLAHTNPSTKLYVVCQEDNIKETLAVGMRSLETSEGLWSEARACRSSWKVKWPQGAWRTRWAWRTGWTWGVRCGILQSEVRVHNKRPKVVLESVVGLRREIRVHKRRRRWSWRWRSALESMLHVKIKIQIVDMGIKVGLEK